MLKDSVEVGISLTVTLVPGNGARDRVADALIEYAERVRIGKVELVFQPVLDERLLENAGETRH